MVEASTKPLLFTAPWCGPCNTVKKAIGDKLEDLVEVINIDDCDPEILKKHNIRGVPCLVIGKEYRMGDSVIIEQINRL